MPASALVSCSTASVPNIVASGSFLSQTASLIETIWTTSASGLYRISLYYYKSSGSGDISGGLEVRDPGSNLNTLAGSGNFFGGDMVVEIPSSGELSVNLGINDGSPTFDLYYTVEQLQ